MKKFHLLGLFVILIGVLLLLNVLGVFVLPADASVWSLIWPAALLFLGIGALAKARCFRLWGLVLLLLGAYFLLRNLNVIPPLPDGVIWPALIILVGIAIFLPAKPLKTTVRVETDGDSKKATSSFADEDGFLRIETSFFGYKRKPVGELFRGADIRAHFSGVELDLSGFMSIAPDCRILLDASFAGVELKLPPHTRVELDELTCKFGEVEYPHPDLSDTADVIRLSGSLAFGSLTVK